MRRFALAAVTALALSACNNGPSIPDGGIACSVGATCPALSNCLCPVSYQACIDGVCATTCPARDLVTGAPCAYPCECASENCALDTQTCCPSVGTVGSGGACASDCDCSGLRCSNGSCS